MFFPTLLHAEPALPLPEEQSQTPDGIHILDGSFVLNVGDLHVNITNHGLIGSQYSGIMPYSSAPSGQWPGGSGNEYLWGAGLWVGARLNGTTFVSTGQYEREFRPDDKLTSTIYEGLDGWMNRPYPAARPAGRRLPHALADDDGDGNFDEDMMNGVDDDGDGQVDEDWGQIGNQMFTCVMRDDLPLIREMYPEHEPLGLQVTQRAFTWSLEEYNDIVGLDFEIKNVGLDDLDEVYLGFYTDCDIQHRAESANLPDDQAGFFSGAVRGSNGSFYMLQVGWMKDAAVSDPLPGWFGVAMLDHDTDFAQVYGPSIPKVRAYEIFATNTGINQDGEPLNDSDRYYLMSREHRDRNTRPDESGDLKFLMSNGPFGLFPAGHTLHYRLALVVGNGMQEMLGNALKAAQVGRGRWYNMDNDWTTGMSGRETKVCLGDYPPFPGDEGRDRLFRYRYSMMDKSCTGDEPIFGVPYIGKTDLFPDEDGRTCVWVNADNCVECFNTFGLECTVENGLYWKRSCWVNVGGEWPRWVLNTACTGYFGRETRLPWQYTSEVPPPAPAIRVEPGDRQVEVFWDDRSEFEPDYLRGVLDFESYRVYRVVGWERPGGVTDDYGPPSTLWGMIEEYDIINEIPAGAAHNPEPVTLGRNTGLEVARYEPVCLADPLFAGLGPLMDEFVLADTANDHWTRPDLRWPDGTVKPGMEPFVPWETWPTVLDTFFAAASRPPNPALNDPGKRSTGYYHYLDDAVHNGFNIFYSVVASDHMLVEQEDGSYLAAGYGIQEDPTNNAQLVQPAPVAQTAEARASEGANIYVYPNPATRQALAEFQQQPASMDDPTGVRVMFNNLPAAANTIKIFTVAGDLVQMLEHDGRGGDGDESWNLMSRNGQEVVSGIYLYTVESAAPGFEPFRGRFVVVR